MSQPLQPPALEVDLAAVRANYQLLKKRHARQELAAVVKANAYGLGMEAISKALAQEGCSGFFVATLAEGIELRGILPDARIGVFNGLLTGEEKEFLHHRLIPVLNTLEQVERWEKNATEKAPAIVHVDTGMTRLGLAHGEMKWIAQRHETFVKNHLMTVMSHLACANEPEHPKNAQQLDKFKTAMHLFPGIKASLSNSSGIFLAPDFHFDYARPGCALYGINPTSGANPMQPVATLSAPILQIRTVERETTVGYGATFKATQGSLIAIAALGYADGWPRQLGNKSFAYVADHKVPVVGRVSMDMVALEITALPLAKLPQGVRAEFINKTQTVNDVAEASGTIGYEIFTGIGSRVQRRYIG